MRVIVDANIAFRAISAHGGDIRLALRPPAPAELCAPRFIFAELFKHKERLLRHTGWDNDTLSRAVHLLTTLLHFESEAAIPIGTWMEAQRLCRGCGLERHALCRAHAAPRRQAVDGRRGVENRPARERLRPFLRSTDSVSVMAALLSKRRT